MESATPPLVNNTFNQPATEDAADGTPEETESTTQLQELQKVAFIEPEEFVVPRGEHRLQTPWSIYWLNKSKIPRPRDSDKSEGGNTYLLNWLKNLRKLGTFNSIESFWRHYVHLKRPSQLRDNFNVAVFRANLVPAWESFPTGGAWIIKISRHELFLDGLWEELLMATIGENFLTPELVGVLLSIRKEAAMITVWNRDNTKNDVRFRVGERLKEILNLDEESTVEYKFFSEAIHDKSTHRNATQYTYTMVEAAPSD